MPGHITEPFRFCVGRCFDSLYLGNPGSNQASDFRVGSFPPSPALVSRCETISQFYGGIKCREPGSQIHIICEMETKAEETDLFSSIYWSYSLDNNARRCAFCRAERDAARLHRSAGTRRPEWRGLLQDMSCTDAFVWFWVKDVWGSRKKGGDAELKNLSGSCWCADAELGTTFSWCSN